VRSASWGVYADGFTYHRNGYTAPTEQGPAWITPQAGMDQYEVRATLLGGNTPTGTLGTWLSLDVNRQWSLNNINYDRECDLLIEIRRKSDGVIVASGTVNILSSGTA
jgi:hypothetical protein